jgi:hypothetical protein
VVSHAHTRASLAVSGPRTLRERKRRDVLKAA